MSLHIFSRDSEYFAIDQNNNVYELPKTTKSLTHQDMLTIQEGIDRLNNKNKKTNNNFIKIEKDICSRLILNVTSLCNLGCLYCYANHGNYGMEKSSDNFMSKETLYKTIEVVYSLYPRGVKSVQFFGGEPLLNSEFIFDACEFINQYCDNLNIGRPKFTIVTNGTLINEEIIYGFNKYFSSVTISLDGTKQLNDKCRVFCNSDDSVWDKTVESIKLMNSHSKNYNIAIESTITRHHIENEDPLNDNSSVSFLQSLDADHYEMSPAFDSCNCKLSVTECDKNQTLEYFDRWFEKYQNFNNTSTIGIAKALKNNVKSSNNCGACLTDIAVDNYGDMYPCFMFINHDEFKICNVHNDSLNFASENSEKIREKLLGANNNETCNNCWAYNLCNLSYGHCIGSRYLTNSDIKKPITIACEIGKTVIERTIISAIKNHNKN